MRTSHHDTSAAAGLLERDLRRNVTVAAWGLALAVAAAALLLAPDAPRAPTTSLAAGLAAVVALGIGVGGTAARGVVSVRILSMLLTEPGAHQRQAQAQAQAQAHHAAQVSAAQVSADTRAADVPRPWGHPLEHGAAAAVSAPL